MVRFFASEADMRIVISKNAKWLAMLPAILLVALSTIAVAQDKAAAPSPGDDVPMFKMGPGMTAPKGVYTPSPEYSEKARKKKLNGTALLTIVVNSDGTVRDAVITRSLEPSLDKEAIKAVSKWKFEPATKDGTPITVRVAVEVSFHLY